MTVLDRRYPAAPQAVAEARRALDGLSRLVRPDCLDNLRLLVSELVTNAIRHGPADPEATVAVTVSLDGRTVHVEVEDGGGGFRARLGPAEDGTSGWGLYLVDQLATRWGIREGEPTRVWFELDHCALVEGDRLGRSRPERTLPGGTWPDAWDPVLLDELPAAVVATDRDGVITRWNGHAERLFGWAAAEVVGRKLGELLVGPADANAVARTMERLRAGDPWEGEWAAPRKDGTHVWVRIANAPIRHADGTPAGMIGVSIDISERKKIQAELDRRLQELRDSERRFRLMSENAPSAIFAYDLSGELLYANQEAEKLTGHPLEELARPRILDWVHPDDLARIRPMWDAVLAGGEMRDEEYRMVTAGGTVRWTSGSWGPLLDERGERIGIQGRERDVTERKEAELALVASEERLRMALDAGAMGTWDWEIVSGRVRWSESLEAIHGLDAGTFGGTFDDFQRDIHPEDRDRLLAAIADAVTAGAEYQQDYRIVRPDGAVRWLSVRGQVFTEGSTPVRMVGVCADITERKELERRLALKDAVAEVLVEAETVEAATPRIIGAIGRAMGWELGAMWLVDEDRDVLRFAGGWHADHESKDDFLEGTRDFAFERGIGLPGRVWANAQPAWIPDVGADPNFPRAPIAIAEEVRAAFGFPLMLGREVLGAIEFFSRSIRSPDEGLLRMVRVLGIQIGQFLERKGAEAAVLESEAMKSAILGSSLEAIVTMAEDGTLVDLNPAAEEMFGLRREDVVGKELAEVMIPESLRGRHRDALARYRQTGEGRSLGRRMELSGLRGGGTEFPLELSVARVDLPGPALFTATLRDITDRRRAEELRAELLANERTARSAAEAARERMSFLADASVILASSLDFRKTLAKVARLAVPRLADWCSIDMVEPDGSFQAVAVTHVDPAKVALAREYRRRFPPSPDQEGGVARVIATGSSVLYPEIPDEMLGANVGDPEQLALAEELGQRSAMIVPLVARGRSLGAITFASAESGRLFGRADLELAEDLGRRAALAIDNARLFEERSHIARTLQRSLLPQRLPEIPRVEVAAVYQPAGVTRTEVGGDFYDVFEIGDRAWGVAMGDVCGKGVEAAALTGLARHTLRSAAIRVHGPAAALEELNEVLRREGGERFCTVAYGRLERAGDDTRLAVACGGHPLPLVLRSDGTVEPAGEPGTLLGIFEDIELHEREVTLHPGDAVVFYTDGLVDTRMSEPFDDVALRALLQTCTEFTAQQIADCFRDAVADPQGEAPDDIAILVVRVTP
ncbi:MAG TPA: PAS domain S-box protein [Actinomycetota bacterium]